MRSYWRNGWVATAEYCGWLKIGPQLGWVTNYFLMILMTQMIDQDQVCWEVKSEEKRAVDGLLVAWSVVDHRLCKIQWFSRIRWGHISSVRDVWVWNETLHIWNPPCLYAQIYLICFQMLHTVYLFVHCKQAATMVWKLFCGSWPSPNCPCFSWF